MSFTFYNEATVIKESIKLLEDVGTINPTQGFDLFVKYLGNEGWTFEEYVLEWMRYDKEVIK